MQLSDLPRHVKVINKNLEKGTCPILFLLFELFSILPHTMVGIKITNVNHLHPSID